jgi:hypothetical protein
MTTDRRQARAAGLSLVLAALGVLQAGCGLKPSAVQLVSYKDAYFPESCRVEISDCTYRIDAGNDVQVTSRAWRAGGGAATQYLHIHVYWKPHPGKTFADSTTTDALLRYVVASEEGVAVYSGTGFAFLRQRFGGRLQVDLESARLHLTSRTGDVPDTLGETRDSGTLLARQDAAATAALVREMTLAEGR